MAEYIKNRFVETVKGALWEQFGFVPIATAINLADNLLANGIIDPVRCRECRNYCKSSGECNKYGHRPGEDGYCSGAVPKDCEE